MSHELDRYAPSTIDPHWSAQVIDLEGGVWWPGSLTWIDARRAQGSDWLTLVLGCLAAWHLLVRLPTLEQLTPLPGEAVRPPETASAGAGDPATEQPVVDERVLSRVRMLLAKAESTTFEAEAETFTAGAQSLMARHSIDAALLAADDAARLRVIIDQVASLTDSSALAWHRRFVLGS